MIGYGTLRDTPGTAIRLSGGGSLAVSDYDMAVIGLGNLVARSSIFASADLLGSGVLFSVATSLDRGLAMLQPLISIGGDTNYAFSEQYLQPLITVANDQYVPNFGNYGIAFLQRLSSYGKANEKDGEGSAFLPKLISRGGDYNYSIGVATLQPLWTYGRWTGKLEESVFFRAIASSVIASVMDQVIFVNNQGQIVDTITAEREYLASIIEQATASGSISVLGQFLFSFNSAASAQATLDANLQFAAGLAEALTATGSLTALGDYLASINSDVTATGTITPNLQQLAELIEAATADGSLLAIADYFATVDGLISVSFSTAGFFTNRANLDTSSRVWVVNMDTEASSQYDNYGFNSFFERDGQQYGVADDGIYLLEGNTDAGTDIAGLIEAGRTNLGTTQKKSVVNVYAGVGSTGKMLLKVDADEQVYIYEARSRSAEVTNNRFDVGRGLSGVYFNFTLMNQNGADFLHDTVTFKPVVLNRKI